MLSSLGSALLNIILNYIFITKFGYIAAGYTTLVSYIVYSLLHYLCYRSIVRLKLDQQCVYDGKRILIISVAFVFCGILFTLLYGYVLIRLIMIFGMALYLYKNRKNLIVLIQMRKNKN